MSRSKTRKNVLRRPRNDSPDLSGLDLTSVVSRYVLVEVTLPDAIPGLDPEEMVDGIVTAYKAEGAKTPPWLTFQVEQVYPGDVVAPRELDCEPISEGDMLNFIDQLRPHQVEELIMLAAHEAALNQDHLRTRVADAITAATTTPLPLDLDAMEAQFEDEVSN